MLMPMSENADATERTGLAPAAVTKIAGWFAAHLAGEPVTSKRVSVRRLIKADCASIRVFIDDGGPWATVIAAVSAVLGGKAVNGRSVETYMSQFYPAKRARNEAEEAEKAAKPEQATERLFTLHGAEATPPVSRISGSGGAPAEGTMGSRPLMQLPRLAGSSGNPFLPKPKPRV